MRIYVGGKDNSRRRVIKGATTCNDLTHHGDNGVHYGASVTCMDVIAQHGYKRSGNQVAGAMGELRKNGRKYIDCIVSAKDGGL